jgi:prolyl-tRNA synthetase
VIQKPEIRQRALDHCTRLEQEIKDELDVTVRCIPLAPGESGTCRFTGQPSARRVVRAKAY